MFQLQAEHRHAAGLIDLKGVQFAFTAALPHKQVVKQALLKIHYYVSACIICLSAICMSV